MALNQTIIPAAQATAAVQAAYEQTTMKMPFSAAMPDRMATAATTESFTPNDPHPDEMVRYAAFGTKAEEGNTFSASSRIAQMLPLRRQLTVNERDLLQGNSPEYVRDRLNSYFTRLGAGFAWRLEAARLAALYEGKLAIDENGVKASYDFERPASHDVKATNWTGAGDPISDLEGWQKIVLKDTRVKPSIMILSSAVMNVLQHNKAVISAATGRGDSLPTVVSVDDVKSVLMRFNGIMSVCVADEVYSQYGLQLPAGFTVPDDQLVLIPQVGVGHTAIGGTIEGVNADYAINQERGFVGYVNAEDNPAGYSAIANGTAIPIVDQARQTVRVKLS